MSEIKRILEKRPEILNLKRIPSQRNRKIHYRQAIKPTYDKLEEMAKEYYNFIKNLRAWEVAKHIEKIFLFGKKCASDYEIKLPELLLFFHQILPKYVGGGLLGCFISGLCHSLMKEDTYLHLDLSPYPKHHFGNGLSSIIKALWS
ncbi:MAG: hypothetical protein KCCBMMGE_00531 [Candidatus Methanoperedenaceae archaeon GB37]|nr:MAG: hypothetical protein KCCBMMGE_00531 [Candidatus Methanoperedenaceae archaeon GB37]